MKKIISILFILLLVVGCSRSQGNSKTKTKETQKVVGSISGKLTLPNPDVPLLDENGKALPDLKIKIDGVDLQVPHGTTGDINVATTSTYTLDSISEIITTYKLTSGSSQLILFGGILVAVGTVLIIFGMIKIGIAAMGAGFSLIACSVVINTYPWVFLIVVAIALCVGIYFIYNQYKKKLITGESDDQKYVLEKMVEMISRLPEEFQEKYFKKPMKEDDESIKVRSITRKARGLK